MAVVKPNPPRICGGLAATRQSWCLSFFQKAVISLRTNLRPQWHAPKRRIGVDDRIADASRQIAVGSGDFLKPIVAALISHESVFALRC
jgi:hypothetical protein